MVTADATYMITIANYRALVAIGNSYNQNPDQFNTEYTKTANDNAGSTEYALLSMFGGSINVFKANPNSSNFVPLVLKNGSVTQAAPCP